MPNNAARWEPTASHHRAHVVHAVFEVGDARHAVGKPGTPFVEADDPGERGKPRKEMRQARVFPGPVQIGDKTRHEHQIARSASRDLVGDTEIAAFGVTGFRRVHW
jgi:hypothetical protein